MGRWVVLLIFLAAPANAAMADGAEMACAGRISKSAVGALPQTLVEWGSLLSAAGIAELTLRIGGAVQGGVKGCLDDAYEQGRREALWFAAAAALLGAAVGYAAARRKPV